MYFLRLIVNLLKGAWLGFRLGARKINSVTICGLTGFTQRGLFQEDLKSYMGRERRQKRPYWIVYFDIDFFKSINDSICYDAGDYVLVIFGKAARICFERKGADLVRWGGDEAIVVVSADKEWVCKRANTTCKLFRNFLFLEAVIEDLSRLYGGRTREIERVLQDISISFGIAEWPEQDISTFYFCKGEAEKQMKQVKRRHHTEKGRSLVRV